MTPLRANIVQANRGERLGCYIFSSCPPPPPGGQVRTAPVVPPPATGAGDFLTQGSAAVEARAAHNREVAGSTPAPATSSCAGGVGSAARETAPAENPKPPAQAGAVILSEHAMILLRAVAAYEQVDNGAAITLALATHVQSIGAGPLARAVLDEFERTDAHHHTPERATVGGEGNPALPAGMLDGEDLHAVPDFWRIGENRFRGGGP